MFKDMKALVIGDICLDIIEEGESTRLSPEAPVPVILNTTKKYSLGMAGNVAVNLKNLGADVYITAWVNDDKYSDKIFDILDEKQIGYKLADYKSDNLENSNSTTIVKKRIFSNGHQIARIDRENMNNCNKLLHLLSQGIPYEDGEFDFVIISDYNKGFINKDTWAYLLPELKRINSGHFFVDTKKVDILDMYSEMFIFPNKDEMESILEYNEIEEREALRLVMGLPFLIETLSEFGANIYINNRTINRKIKIEKVNTVYGAGDVFISAFSLYYSKYNNEINALNFANYCCYKAVARKDRCLVKLEEVKDFRRRNN